MRRIILLGLFWTTIATVQSASAAIVTLTLDPATNSVNTLDLSILTETAQSELSGTIDADLQIDLTTGEITGVKLVGGTIDGSPWSMLPLGLDATASTATMETNVPNDEYSAVNGITFAANQHQMRLITGTLMTPTGNLGLANTVLLGAGDGSIESTLNGGQYDIEFRMTINDSVSDGLPAELMVSGPLLARGSITAIPEPGSALLIACGIAGLAIRRRRAPVC